MLALHQARQKVVEFCDKELNKDSKSIRFLKLMKLDTGWSTRIEITEQNEYLKKLDYPPVFDKNIYNIELDGNGNIIGFFMKGEEAEEEF